MGFEPGTLWPDVGSAHLSAIRMFLRIHKISDISNKGDVIILKFDQFAFTLE